MNPRRPVRVLHVVYSLQPGGMEHGVVKLVNGLDTARVASAICSTTPGGSLRPLVHPGVPVFELNRRRGNDPAFVSALWRLIRRERPDVVHTHGWGTLIEGLCAAKLARVPVTIHGEHGTLQLRWHQRLAQRWAWRAADQMVSVSSRLAERLARDVGFPLDRVRTLRNGVDLARFASVDRSAARAALGVRDDERVIVTAGRLVPVKDQSTLLKALAPVCHADLGVRPRLLIAGEGPLEKSLKAEADTLGVTPFVTWLGHRPDVEAVFAAGDLFVLSSVSEGMSNTILEAMASGLPVVATHVGGADEMVVDRVTGRLVPPAAPQALADAILSVLRSDESRTAMGAEGRRRAQAEFGLEGMIRRYEALYLELIDGKGGQAGAAVAAVH